MSLFNPSKNHSRKVILICLVGLAGVYCYFTYLLEPLRQAQDADEMRTVELRGRLNQSSIDLEKAARLETAAREAEKRLATIKSQAELGAPVAWFPPLIKNFFFSEGIEQSSTRLAQSVTAQEKDLAGFERTQWSIELPDADFFAFARALARLENEQPLVAINALSVTAMAEPATQHISVGARMIAPSKN